MRLKAMVMAAILVASPLAHAESFFEAEVGLGVQKTKDMGDGIWVQQGLAHREDLTTPAFLVGVTGPIYVRGPYDLRWHLDYVYMGSMSVTSLAVPDAAYDPVAHRVTDQSAQKVLFVSGGHTQGVSATLEAGYTYAGWRVSVEAGPWVYWPSWSVSVYDASGAYAGGLKHPSHAQVDLVVGAGVEKGNFGVKYRYYRERPYWGGAQIPAIGTGTQMVYLEWRF